MSGVEWGEGVALAFFLPCVAVVPACLGIYPLSS